MNDHKNTQKNATIRDDALILYFDTAENPFVARFDLESLVQANFEVTQQGEAYELSLRDFGGNRQSIGRFVSKVDAHQALYAILQALLSQSQQQSQSVKRSWLASLTNWILIILGVAALAYLVLAFMPVTRAPDQRHTVSAPAEAPQVPATSMPAPPSDGQPVDLDMFMPPADQSAQ